jgi:DNA-binding LacI/PurR family transcriptional regulator
MAMGVYQAAQEMGLRIPEDLSVVGFDNITESKYMGLTTVDQFISEMGYVATRMLIKLINGEPLEDQTYKDADPACDPQLLPARQTRGQTCVGPSA